MRNPANARAVDSSTKVRKCLRVQSGSWVSLRSIKSPKPKLPSFNNPKTEG